jgi:hypothetical protein
MRYVIIRDDDTNALTPPECLERLYRPFLRANLPVNLAAIPAVNTDARMSDGSPEGFLVFRNGEGSRRIPIGQNAELIRYLRGNPGFRIVQHGCHHDFHEFDSTDAAEISRRLDEGADHLGRAGFGQAAAFVAPYDKLSRASLREVSLRFRVISTGWFELGRLPFAWWPRYLLKKAAHEEHWQVGGTLLLSHPGCILSCHRGFDRMLQTITEHVNRSHLTVLVTHWWEYFRDGGRPDEEFISFLHETANYLASHPGVKVIRFEDLVESRIPLN